MQLLKQSPVQVVIEEKDEYENKEMLAHFSEITNSGVNVLQQSHSCSDLVLGFCKPLIKSYLFISV